jgi:hypothetical protein
MKKFYGTDWLLGYLFEYWDIYKEKKWLRGLNPVW